MITQRIRKKSRPVIIKTLLVTLPTHLIGAPGARRRHSTDAGPRTPVFSHVHFCIKKFSPRQLSHGPPRRTGKKHPALLPGVTHRHVGAALGAFLLYHDAQCVRGANAHRGVVGASIEGAQVFFSFPFRRGQWRQRRKGGSGRRNCTRAETPCGRREKQREREGGGGHTRQRKREGGNDPYGTPNGTDSSQRRKVQKNDFREGSKKTKILLGC